MSLGQECREAAEFYEAKPGLAGAQTDIDLYRVCARMADSIEALQRELAEVRQELRRHGHG